MLGDSLRRSHGRSRRRNADRNRPASNFRWGRWLIAVLVAIPLAFGTGYALATIVIFPVTTGETGDLVAMPDLVGSTRGEAERKLRAIGLELSDLRELPNLTAPAGEITAQAPLPGQLLQIGAGASIAVSTGRPRLAVPDLVGLNYENAAEIAERLGFQTGRQTDSVPGAEGLVTRVEPAPGTERLLPATITIFTAAEPVTEEPDSTVVGQDPELQEWQP